MEEKQENQSKKGNKGKPVMLVIKNNQEVSKRPSVDMFPSTYKLLKDVAQCSSIPMEIILDWVISELHDAIDLKHTDIAHRPLDLLFPMLKPKLNTGLYRIEVFKNKADADEFISSITPVASIESLEVQTSTAPDKSKDATTSKTPTESPEAKKARLKAERAAKAKAKREAKKKAEAEANKSSQSIESQDIVGTIGKTDASEVVDELTSTDAIDSPEKQDQ